MEGLGAGRRGRDGRGEVVATAALLIAAAIWGLTFPLVKTALTNIGTVEFLALRFALATLLLVVLWPGAARHALRKGAGTGAFAGALLAVGHILQTTGLERTTSTNAGFITGLYVLFTPIIAAVALRRRLRPLVLVGVVLTTAGLALLSLHVSGGGIQVGAGDLLVLGSAAVYGGQIVVVAHHAPRADPRVFTIQQLGVSALVFLAALPAARVTPPTQPSVWVALLATAVGSSGFGIGVQAWAQRRVPPTRAALVFATEAPFAALFASLLAGERLTPRGWAGAVLILAGVVVAEIRPSRSTEA